MESVIFRVSLGTGQKVSGKGGGGVGRSREGVGQQFLSP